MVDTFVSSVHFLCKPLLVAHVVADCQLVALTYDEHRVGTVRCLKALLLITNHDTCQAKRGGPSPTGLDRGRKRYYLKPGVETRTSSVLGGRETGEKTMREIP